MESLFSRDFGTVRVHTDGAAAAAARAEGAAAYTTGRDIIFRDGRFLPETFEGKRLLAHELAHVVQQSRPGDRVADPSHEAEARDAGERAVAGAPIAVQGSAAPGIQRTDEDEARRAAQRAGATAQPQRGPVPPSSQARVEPRPTSDPVAAAATAQDFQRRYPGRIDARDGGRGLAELFNRTGHLANPQLRRGASPELATLANLLEDARVARVRVIPSSGAQRTFDFFVEYADGRPAERLEITSVTSAPGGARYTRRPTTFAGGKTSRGGLVTQTAERLPDLRTIEEAIRRKGIGTGPGGGARLQVNVPFENIPAGGRILIDVPFGATDPATLQTAMAATQGRINPNVNTVTFVVRTRNAEGALVREYRHFERTGANTFEALPPTESAIPGPQPPAARVRIATEPHAATAEPGAPLPPEQRVRVATGPETAAPPEQRIRVSTGPEGPMPPEQRVRVSTGPEPPAPQGEEIGVIGEPEPVSAGKRLRAPAPTDVPSGRAPSVAPAPPAQAPTAAPVEPTMLPEPVTPPAAAKPTAAPAPTAGGAPPTATTAAPHGTAPAQIPESIAPVENVPLLKRLGGIRGMGRTGFGGALALAGAALQYYHLRKTGHGTGESIYGTAGGAAGAVAPGGGVALVVGLVNAGLTMAGAPKPLTDVIGTGGDVIPANFVSSSLSTVARASWNVNEAIRTGDWSSFDRQMKEVTEGKAGMPLEGYFRAVSLHADIRDDIVSKLKYRHTVKGSLSTGDVVDVVGDSVEHRFLKQKFIGAEESVWNATAAPLLLRQIKMFEGLARGKGLKKSVEESREMEKNAPINRAFDYTQEKGKQLMQKNLPTFIQKDLPEAKELATKDLAKLEERVSTFAEEKKTAAKAYVGEKLAAARKYLPF